MLKLTLKRGDAVHLVLADGTNGIIEARSRCELGLHLPENIKVTREKSAFTPQELITPNQKKKLTIASIAIHQTPEDHNAAMATGSNSALRI